MTKTFEIQHKADAEAFLRGYIQKLLGITTMPTDFVLQMIGKDVYEVTCPLPHILKRIKLLEDDVAEFKREKKRLDFVLKVCSVISSIYEAFAIEHSTQFFPKSEVPESWSKFATVLRAARKPKATDRTRELASSIKRALSDYVEGLGLAAPYWEQLIALKQTRNETMHPLVTAELVKDIRSTLNDAEIVSAFDSKCVAALLSAVENNNLLDSL